MTKKMTTSEKMALLQHHGEAIATAFSGVQSPHRDDLIDHAERALALIRSIPKLEFAIEQ